MQNITFCSHTLSPREDGCIFWRDCKKSFQLILFKSPTRKAFSSSCFPQEAKTTLFSHTPKKKSLNTGPQQEFQVSDTVLHESPDQGHKKGSYSDPNNRDQNVCSHGDLGGGEREGCLSVPIDWPLTPNPCTALLDPHWRIKSQWWLQCSQ